LQVTLSFMRDYARAQQTLDSILEIAPDDGTTFVDKVVLGLVADGDTALAGRYEAAPPSPQYEHGLAYTYSRWLAAVIDRDYARAIRALDEASEEQIFNGDLRPSRIPGAALEARARLLAGDADRARSDFARLAAEMEPRVARAVADDAIAASADFLTVAEALVESGERERGIEWMRRARVLVPKANDVLSGSATQLASIIRVLVPAGEGDEAIRELDDYLAGPGQWSIEALSSDPRLDPIRGDPRFEALVAKYRRR
jgi:hypothetical protein